MSAVFAKPVDVEIAIEIERHPEAVWAAVSDPERWPEWVDEFEDVVPESDAPIGKGSVFRYTVLPGHRSATIEIVEWEPGVDSRGMDPHSLGAEAALGLEASWR